jgi:hypothetical protein
MNLNIIAGILHQTYLKKDIYLYIRPNGINTYIRPDGVCNYVRPKV